MDYVRVYCQEDKCPYKKSRCCIGEVSKDSVIKDPDLSTRNKCKMKKSKIVIGKPVA